MTNDEYQQLIEFLGRKFESIDRRFDRVEAKLAEHDARFDAVDERFREISVHFDLLYRRLGRLEQEYQAILEGLRRIERLLFDERGKREVAALQEGIDVLEQRIR